MRAQLLLALVLGLVIGNLLPRALESPVANACQCHCDARPDPVPDPLADPVDPVQDPVPEPYRAENRGQPSDPVAEPVPDPVQPDSGARSSEIPKLTLQSLVAHVDSLDARLRDTFQAMSSRGDCDMAQNDATVLVTAADLMKVDVILESGTAGGYSTEFMARFFQNQKVQITTVDFGDDRGGRCATRVKDTHQRLRQFQQVKAIIGDSFKMFPKLIQANAGKRIGLFIDGPKGMLGVKLCLKALRMTKDVVYCLFHDVSTKDKPSKEIYDFLHSWGRRVALTCCDRAWLQHTKQYGASAKMGVVSGTALVAYGVHGDD